MNGLILNTHIVLIELNENQTPIKTCIASFPNASHAKKTILFLMT